QGAQGTTGFTGSQGIQGVIGYTGSQGVIGYTGSRGATGFTGSQGTQGATGATGFTGSRGATGFTGSQGAQGATGFTGSQGTQGAIGYTGSASTVAGPTGFTGSQGAIGYTGSANTQPITISGDASGSGTTAISLTLANSGATAGTYKSVTVDAKGRVTGGSNPTTLAGYGITDAAPSSHVGATGAAHGAATTSVAGFMSAADKSKLDGIATGATANTGTVTGVTATAPVVSSGGTAPVISMAAATASTNGYMTSTYAAKLDGISPAIAAPLMDGSVASVGTSTMYARADHVHEKPTTLGNNGNTSTPISIMGGVHMVRYNVAADNVIDLDKAAWCTKTISGATTFSVARTGAQADASSFILDLENGGSAAITWWSGIKWAGGTAPTLTAAGRDVLGFFTIDGGFTWTGLVLGKDIK
ncbi:hypothetical protein E6P97_03440, partial [Patescibacteria group bacterium]